MKGIWLLIVQVLAALFSFAHARRPRKALGLPLVQGGAANVIEDEFRITAQATGLTLAAGSANVESKIAEFTVPNRTAFVIRPGDIFSLLAQNSGSTAVANTSVVKVVHSDANGIVKEMVAVAPYTALLEWQDRNKLYTFGKKTTMLPQELLQIFITADLATATATTQFQISALRATQSFR